MDNWKNDPRIRYMSPEKLQFVEQMSTELNQKKQDEVLPFLLAVMGAANQRNISFTDEEASLIIDLIMPNRTAEDQNRIEMFKRMAQMFMKG